MRRGFLLPVLQRTQTMEDAGSVEYNQLGISVMRQFHSTAGKQNTVMGPCFHIILMGREKGIVFPHDTEVLSLI